MLGLRFRRLPRLNEGGAAAMEPLIASNLGSVPEAGRQQPLVCWFWPFAFEQPNNRELKEGRG